MGSVTQIMKVYEEKTEIKLATKFTKKHEEKQKKLFALLRVLSGWFGK